MPQYKRVHFEESTELLPLLTIRGVKPPHPPPERSSNIKPESRRVVSGISRNAWSIESTYPFINIKGLRPKPQKKIQRWEPSDETFAFICKRMIEDTQMDRAYQNSLSVADRETFSSRCKKLKMDDMKDIIWRKKS
ncbi:hypothetical protein IRJ41_010795 [Triplophysa rosa]|uniref:Uncharacterized protein n=1 Tax=Triplophysa rosa TaxID=992332 RepID=A0A9W7TB72_TRIRA|nr:hypothetical protein IRJ41_010795 [Triplophysa rosa]